MAACLGAGRSRTGGRDRLPLRARVGVEPRPRTGPGPSAEIAAHAAEYLTRVAEQVFVHQARAAERPFRRALRIIDASPRAVDPAVAARASIGLAEVLIEMGAHAEAIEQARRARKLAERAADGLLVARALLALGRSESDNGRMGRARTLLEDARERFEHEGDLRGQGWALHRLSETWGWEGFERELEDLRAAYRLFARARDRFGRSVVANDLAYILSVEGGREFHQWYAKASDLAEDEGDLRSRALLLRSWGNFCNSAGSFEEAARTMAAGRPVAAEAGERYAEADALLVEALATVNIGDPALAHSLGTGSGGDRSGAGLGADPGDRAPRDGAGGDPPREPGCVVARPARGARCDPHARPPRHGCRPRRDRGDGRAGSWRVVAGRRGGRRAGRGACERSRWVCGTRCRR